MSTHVTAYKREDNVGRRVHRVHQVEVVLKGPARNRTRDEARAQLVVQRRRVVVAVIRPEEHHAAQKERGPSEPERGRG